MSSRVVLVDDDDHTLGTSEKLRAHMEGLLHRAISVFVFDDADRLLLQKRSRHKYHSGGLWSNTCCSHPHPGEDPVTAAHRRLDEEMGISCDLSPAFCFTYRATVGAGLTEHEYDHIFIARTKNPSVHPDPNEVAEWTWIAPSALKQDVSARPEQYTVWFRQLLERVLRVAPTILSADVVPRDPSE